MDSVFALKAVLYPGNQSWDKAKNSITFLDTLKSASPRISHCRERKGMKGTQITPSSNKFCQTKCRSRKAWNKLGGGGLRTENFAKNPPLWTSALHSWEWRRMPETKIWHFRYEMRGSTTLEGFRTVCRFFYVSPTLQKKKQKQTPKFCLDTA